MRRLLMGALTGLACGVTMAASAGIALADDPLMGKAPWSFTPVNRAGLAIAIRDAEQGGTGGSGGGTTVVCGGTSGSSGDGSNGSGASSTANNTCVIVNNSSGAIVNVDQDSQGNQSSHSSSKTKSKTAAKSQSIDEVAAILEGRSQ